MKHVKSISQPKAPLPAMAQIPLKRKPVKLKPA